jgi:hypothetical protein
MRPGPQSPGKPGPTTAEVYTTRLAPRAGTFFAPPRADSRVRKRLGLFPSRAVVRAVPLAPGRHKHQDRPQTLTMARERILHTGGHLCENLSMNHVVAFEFAKMLGQHFFGRAGNGPLQFTEAMRSAFQVVQDNRFPFSADNFRCEFDGAIEFEQRSLRGNQVTKRCLLGWARL